MTIKIYYQTLLPFLLQPKELSFYFGSTHLAIEYHGKESGVELQSNGTYQISVFNYTESDNDFLENIIGINFSNKKRLKIPLPNFTEDLIAPKSTAFDLMVDLGWNFNAQNAMIMLNPPGFELTNDQFSRQVNSLFFDSNSNGLITRHIKWIDFIPLKYENINDELFKILIDLNIYRNIVEGDANYIYPLPDNNDFKFSKLPQLNRLIEIAGNSSNSELDITSFLEEEQNNFILSMAFLAKEIYPQLECRWQSENRQALKPDFFVLRHNGYADILEFKLPHLKNNTVVGIANREKFSAEISNYIAQTRVYEEYFNDPNNRNWFEQEYGFKVLHPKRILVVARRKDFETNEWKKLQNEYRNIQIVTYDELIDGVMAQFYA